MKLGTETGSLVNHLRSNHKPSIPEVGMGATLLLYSDRDPYTIRKVEGKKLWASRDSYTRTDTNGMSESQEYDYSNDNQNDESYWTLFTLRKDGKWHRGTTLDGMVLRIGNREKYYDFTF